MKADVVLKRDVQEELAWEPSIDAAYIDVAVKNGVVTLTGRVNSYPEKQVAETAAKRVAGVQQVEETIEVHLPPGLSKCKDSEISQVVQTILKWNVAVADDKVLLSVKNGWITLEGEVHWQYQKIALENALRYVRGVTGMTNNIGIVPRAKVVQARTKVEAALLRNGGLDAHRIEVDTDGRHGHPERRVRFLGRASGSGTSCVGVTWGATGEKSAVASGGLIEARVKLSCYLHGCWPISF